MDIDSMNRRMQTQVQVALTQGVEFKVELGTSMVSVRINAALGFRYC